MLAAPSILSGINQNIMLSLAMVVVASLIDAEGLGEDVLEALQHASVGQGILAGFSVLFCAMILDRVVQGRRGWRAVRRERGRQRLAPHMQQRPGRDQSD